MRCRLFAVLTVVSSLLLAHPAQAVMTLAQVMAEKEKNVLSLVNATERVFSTRCTENNLCVVNTTRCTFNTCGNSPAFQKQMICDFSLGTDTTKCGTLCPSGLLRSTTTSVVSVASGATNNQESTTFICSTASLTSVFADLYYNQGVTGWQYVASNTGVTRQFPAAASPNSCSKPPDTRQQSWYVSASTGPKDVIFVCDFSGSMGSGDGGPGGMTRANAMKIAVVDLLGSLGPNDRFNIVAFSSSPAVVGTAGELMEGSPANILLMQNRFRNYPVGGGTTFGTAMTMAFNLFTAKPSSTTGCARILMFLTDGQPSDGSTVFSKISDGQAQLGSNKARVFTYSLSSAATHSTLQQIACQNSGIWSMISDASSPTSPLQQYYNFLAAGIVDSRPQWTSPYQSDFGQGLIVTVSQPIFDKSQTPKVFVGVAAIDVLMSELLQYGTTAQINAAIATKSTYCLNYDLTQCQMQKLRQGSNYVCPSPAPTIASCASTHVTVPSCNTTIVTNINEVVCDSTTPSTAPTSTEMTCCSPAQCATKSNELTPSRSVPQTITIQESFSKTHVKTDTWSASNTDEGTKTLTIRPTASTSNTVTQSATVSEHQTRSDTLSKSLNVTATKTIHPTFTATVSRSASVSVSSARTASVTIEQSLSIPLSPSLSVALTLTERISPTKLLSRSRTVSYTSTHAVTVSGPAATLTMTLPQTFTLNVSGTAHANSRTHALTPTNTKAITLTGDPETATPSWGCVNGTALLAALTYSQTTLVIDDSYIINGFNETIELPPLPGLEDESFHLPWFTPFTLRMIAKMRPTQPQNEDGFKKMPGYTANITVTFLNGLGSTTLARANHSIFVSLDCPPHPEFSIYAGEAIDLAFDLEQLTLGSICTPAEGSQAFEVDLILLLINTPNSIFVGAAQTLITSTIITTGIAAAAFGGAAPDMQVLIMTAMIPCAGTYQKRSFELYRAISPFAISDSYEGILWGNLVANFGAVSLHAGVMFAYSFFKKKSLGASAAAVWFPNLSLQLMILTYPGTAFSVGQSLIEGNLTVQKVLLSVAMLLIFVVGYPAGMMIYIMRNVEASYDRFEYHRWKREASGLRVRLLSRVLMPVGSWDPSELRRTFGTVITLQCRPEYIWITFPAWSPLIVAILGLFDFDSKTWCLVLYSIMLLLHLLMILIVAYFKPFRSLFEDWCVAIALSLTSIFIVMTVINLQMPASKPAQNLLWIVGVAQLALLIVRTIYHIAHIFIARNLRQHVPHVFLFSWNLGYVEKNEEIDDATEMLSALLKETGNGFDDDLGDLLNLDADGDQLRPADEEKWWRELEETEKHEKKSRDAKNRSNSEYLGVLQGDNDSEDEYK